MTGLQIEEFLEARKRVFFEPERFQNARRVLLECAKADVLAQFETRLQSPDEEQRAAAIEGLTLLYEGGATDTIIRWVADPSSTVRWVVCGCLQDFGGGRAVAPLLDRLKLDSDSQVRGAAACALGRIGSLECLPLLHQTFLADDEVDVLGHTPSDHAQEAITSMLRNWVIRQIQGAPSENFQESTQSGLLTGAVTAQAIPFDPDGRITHTTRYAHLPHSAFGFVSSIDMDVQTSLRPPFEIKVEYVDPTCVIQRVLVFQPASDNADVVWAVHSIVEFPNKGDDV